MKNTLADNAASKKSTADGNKVANFVRSKFPWAAVQSVNPTTGDVILGYGKTISQRELRMLQDDGPENGYVLFEEKGQPPRLQVIGSPQGKRVK